MRVLGQAIALCARAAPLASAISIGVMIVNGVTPVALAWSTKLLVDGLAEHDAARLRLGVAGLVVTGLLTPLVSQVRRYYDQEMSRRITLRTQVDLFTAVSHTTGSPRSRTVGSTTGCGSPARRAVSRRCRSRRRC